MRFRSNDSVPRRGDRARSHGRIISAITRCITRRCIDNTIIQAANGDNSTIINYDLSRGGAATGLIIANNRIVNRHPSGVLLRNDSPLTPTLAGNKIINEARGKIIKP